MLHKTIKAVTNDIETLSFNTATARMMEFVNFFTKQSKRPQSAMETFLLLLSPYAPHMAEELWGLLGNGNTLAYEPWPKFDDSMTVDQTIEIPIQFKGKVKARINVERGLDKDALLAAAKSDPKVAELLEGKKIIKEIAVPDRLVNFVTS